MPPEFEVKLSKREKYTWNKIVVDEKLLDQQIGDYTRRYGKLSEPEVSEDKDMLVVDLIELNDDESIKEGGIMSNATVSIEHLKDKATKKALVGLKKDDSVVVDAKKLAEDDNDLMRLLNIEAEQLPGISSKFKLNVKEIRRMLPAELNQELFDKILGEGTVDSEEAFKEEISKRIAGQLEEDSKKLFKKQLTEKMLDKL